MEKSKKILDTVLGYRIPVKTLLKWNIFAVFGFLFILNNQFYPSLAGQIEDELIRSYRQPDSPIANIVEVTKTLNPTVVIQEFTQSITPTEVATPTKSTVPKTRPTIPEDELWQALLTYRKANGKKEILRSDSLCQYARKRAEELSDRLKTHPDDPLDEHAGFKRDADSGYVFTATGFNQIGENLAYTPSYTTGTQVIEWGWDSSPKHKALQLSDTITHGCITGIHPIYVAIYGS